MRPTSRQKLMDRHRSVGAAVLMATVAVWAGGCAGSSASHSDLGIGVVDPQRVLEETKAGKEAKDTLGEFTKNRRALLELEEKDLKRMEESLIKQASVLSANARRGREEKFRQRMIRYQQKATELNREVQDKQREVLESFRERIEKVVARVALDLELIVVIEKGRGGPTLYHDAAIDISDRVIEAMNKEGG